MQRQQRWPLVRIYERPKEKQLALACKTRLNVYSFGHDPRLSGDGFW